MNIFVLHRNPVIAAQSVCDVHASKMTLEATQMLASAAIRHGAQPNELPLTDKGKPYKGGYHKHPCTVWAGDTRANYEWLCWHAIALSQEFYQRYGKAHSCAPKIIQLCGLMDKIPEGELTPFARAIKKETYPDLLDTEVFPNTVIAYRVFYMLDKRRFATWNHGTKPPSWWNPNFKLPETKQEQMEMII